MTLYRKTSAVWIIGVHTRSRYYHDTLDFEDLKLSIRESLHKLDGVLYGEDYNATYTIALLDEIIVSERPTGGLSAYELVYWGICILRARHDMKVGIRDIGELYHAIMDFEPKFLPKNSGMSPRLSLGLMILAGFHENLLKVSDSHGLRYIGSHVDNTIEPIITSFTTDLYRECIFECAIHEMLKKDDEKAFWNDTCLTTSCVHNYRPLNDWTVNLQTLLTHMDDEYYFHPRHSSNPEDHYRFLCSLLPLRFKGNDIEEKRKTLMNVVSRVSEKKIMTQDYINKREMFADVHQELLYSPNLPIWFGNEYTRSKEHFDATKLSSTAVSAH